MNDLADAVKVIEPHQALFRHDASQGHRNSLVIVPLYDFKQVNAKDFEDHHEVLAVGTVVQEAVQELDTVAIIPRDILKFLRLVLVVCFERVQPCRFNPIASDLVEDLNLVERSNEVVASRPLNFERHERVVLDVPSKPHSREVAPAQLLNKQVPID